MKTPAVGCVRFLAVLALAWCGGARAGLEGTAPNIVLIITDDQGYGPIGCHGHPWIKTPHLDSLHGRSARFTRFLVSPTCAPTRAALMTGRHPLKNGVTHTILERERMTTDAVTLPQVLAGAGYRSGIFGKWHLGDEAPHQPERRGFDEVFIHGAGGIGQKYDCSCADAPGNKYFDPVIRHNGRFVRTEGFCTDVFFTAALGWIHAVKDSGKPFFAYVSTNAPHGPFIAPEASARRFKELGFTDDEAGFYGMIENIDDNVGRMLGKLEDWDLLRSTVVIFLSDNGMTGGGSGRLGTVMGRVSDGAELFPYNAGMKGLKGSVDEGGVRVPFFIRWDGRITPGRDIDRIAAHLDILPTLAALAGAAVPEGQVEGRSLVPLLEGGDAGWPDRYLFNHVGRWPVGTDPDSQQWVNFSVRSQRFRYVGPSARNSAAPGTLYDMEENPGQTQDVAARHPETVAAMRSAYDAFWKEARPLMVNEGVGMSPTRPYWVWFDEQERSGGIPDWVSPAW